MSGVNLGINVAIDGQDIRPPIVIHVDECRSPTEKTGVKPQARIIDGRGESSVTVVAIEGRAVIGEIGLENIGMPIVVVIPDGGAHPRLLTSIFVVRDSGIGGDVDEGSVPQIVVEDAGGAVAGYINVRPAVVIIVDGGDAEAIVAVGFFDTARSADIREFAAAKIVIQQVGR